MSREDELLDEIARVDCCLSRSSKCRHAHEDCTRQCPCQVRRYMHWKPIVERLLAAEREKRAEILALHTAAVSDFLNELYAIMVDPLAEGVISVEEMKKALLEAAIRDRMRR